VVKFFYQKHGIIAHDARESLTRKALASYPDSGFILYQFKFALCPRKY